MARYFDESLMERADIATPGPDSFTSFDTLDEPVETPIPLPLVVHMVARLLSGRPTPIEEVPALVRTVSEAVARILNPARAEAAPEIEVRPQAPRPQRRRSGRQPGRPRKEKVIVVPEAAEPPPPPMPRLVRRAEAVVSAPAPEAAPFELPAAGTLRGVVRWFDPARQTGGLRLTGLPEDVALEPQVFQAAGVTRLFKGQEVEAVVARADGRVRITELRIPGGPLATGISGPIAATGRRPRVVIVEKKRDALRRVAARTEAEHLLGARGESKRPR